MPGYPWHGNLAQRYHRAGQVETDTPAIAAARRQQAQIQRDHRQQRREGEEPSQTPSISALLEQNTAQGSIPAVPTPLQPALTLREPPAPPPALPPQPLLEQTPPPAAPQRRGRPAREGGAVGRSRGRRPPTPPTREFDVPPPVFSGNLL